MNLKESEKLLKVLKARFEENMDRHRGLKWNLVLSRLEENSKKLKSLMVMEESGGEPDVIDFDKRSGEFLFVDCSPETPKGRRGVCYDKKARMARKEHAPKSSAMEMAESMGIEILDEALYRKLQTLGEFDRKTSSWILTPGPVRKFGGALFADHRYGQTFVYHNGVQSYYAVRGFRGYIRI